MHPYRQGDPETVSPEYRNLRMLIERYKPKNKAVPILSGEWGYSTAWNQFNDERQGKYLPRQWITNLMNDVPLSIFYDSHDDGTEPQEAEHHFGTVQSQYHENRDPIYDPNRLTSPPKPFTRFFDGYNYNKRLALASPNDYLLLFTRRDRVKVAVWTTGKPHQITLPASCGPVSRPQLSGSRIGRNASAKRRFAIANQRRAALFGAKRAQRDLRAAATWKRLPLETWIKAPHTLSTGGKSVLLTRESAPSKSRSPKLSMASPSLKTARPSLPILCVS